MLDEITGLMAVFLSLSTPVVVLMMYYKDRELCKETRQKGYNLFMNEMLPVNAYNKIMAAINN